MSTRKQNILIVIAWFTVAALWAQEVLPNRSDSIAAESIKNSLRKIIDQVASPGELVLEIDGLIVDETLTKSGRDFYELFYSRWQPPPGAQNFTIIIKEQPSAGPGIGTQVTVLINETKVVAIPLQPRYNIIESSVDYALGMSGKYLLNYNQIQKDLQTKDKLGSGIF